MDRRVIGEVSNMKRSSCTATNKSNATSPKMARLLFIAKVFLSLSLVSLIGIMASRMGRADLSNQAITVVIAAVTATITNVVLFIGGRLFNSQSSGRAYRATND